MTATTTTQSAEHDGVCDRCGGTGKIVTARWTNHAPANLATCPDCSGSGCA